MPGLRLKLLKLFGLWPQPLLGMFELYSSSARWIMCIGELQWNLGRYSWVGHLSF